MPLPSRWQVKARNFYVLTVIWGGERENHSWLSTEEPKERFIQELQKKDLFHLSYRICSRNSDRKNFMAQTEENMQSRDIFVLRLQVYTKNQWSA